MASNGAAGPEAAAAVFGPDVLWRDGAEGRCPTLDPDYTCARIRAYPSWHVTTEDPPSWKGSPRSWVSDLHLALLEVRCKDDTLSLGS